MAADPSPALVVLQDPLDYPLDELHAHICTDLNVGLLVVNRQNRILVWNRFMEIQSGLKAEEVRGHSLFELFPDLPAKWLQKKLQTVFVLNNNSYSSWKDRPHVFAFKHNRPITGIGEYMYQDCSFIPIRNQHGKPDAVCIAIFDMTDVGIYHDKLKEASDLIVSLEQLALHDALTGVHNRSHLETRLEEEFLRSAVSGSSLALLMLDIDHFKRINDSYGHQAGDEVLRIFAITVRGAIRNGDIVCRYGGEEFTVLLPSASFDEAFAVGERIRQAVQNTVVMFGGVRIQVTVSVGMSIKSDKSRAAANLIHDADKALYEAKSGGRNQVRAAS